MRKFKEISYADALNLLVDGEMIHVFREIKSDGPVDEFYWKRQRVLDHINKHGCELSGDNYRKIRHGLCSESEGDKFLFFETRRSR